MENTGIIYGSRVMVIVRWFINIIYKLHTKILSLNDSFATTLSDKELHFLVVGIFGVALILFFGPIFKWLSKKNLTIVITWFYAFTILVVMTFAIEIGQGYTNTGVMDFDDIVAGLMGYFVFSFILIVIIFIGRGIIKMIKNDKDKKI